MRGLLVFFVILALVAFGASRLAAWLRTVQVSPVPIGYGGNP